MARTANVFARVEPEVKEQAEQVLDRLGIPMSNAVGMFLRQIVLQRGIPSHHIRVIDCIFQLYHGIRFNLWKFRCFQPDIHTIAKFHTSEVKP